MGGVFATVTVVLSKILDPLLSVAETEQRYVSPMVDVVGILTKSPEDTGIPFTLHSYVTLKGPSSTSKASAAH